jgi:hypothetical protein
MREQVSSTRGALHHSKIRRVACDTSEIAGQRPPAGRTVLLGDATTVHGYSFRVATANVLVRYDPWLSLLGQSWWLARWVTPLSAPPFSAWSVPVHRAKSSNLFGHLRLTPR